MNLKEMREKSGMSQSQLSRTAGVNIKTLQSYEQGIKDINRAQVGIVLKLAKALGCTIEELIE